MNPVAAFSGDVDVKYPMRVAEHWMGMRVRSVDLAFQITQGVVGSIGPTLQRLKRNF